LWLGRDEIALVGTAIERIFAHRDAALGGRGDNDRPLLVRGAEPQCQFNPAGRGVHVVNDGTVLLQEIQVPDISENREICVTRMVRR
jgi:hypothetical protein